MDGLVEEQIVDCKKRLEKLEKEFVDSPSKFALYSKDPDAGNLMTLVVSPKQWFGAFYKQA